MSFKYINPGYGYLVDPAFETIWSTRLSPRLGVSFYLKNHSDGYKGYTIPAIGYGGTLYFKFDVFIPQEKFSLLTGLGNDDDEHAWIEIWSNGEYFYTFSLIDMYGDTPIWIDDEFGDFFNFDTVNTIWVQIKLEDEFDEDGGATVKVNGRTIGECKDLQTWAQKQTIFVIDGKEKTPVSNLIISDEYIDPDENIFRVDARQMSCTFMEYTDNANQRTFEFRYDWGKYADFGEVELYSLNPKNLYSAVGSNEKVLTMAAICEPAFYSGSEKAAELFANAESSTASCYVVTGNGSDDYNRTDYPRQNLSSDTSAVLIQYLPVTSDTTFASLNGWNVGWRAELGSA